MYNQKSKTMKQIEKTATAANFTAINFGKLNELGDYVLELSPEVKIPGKVFGGAALQATGSEFSFQLFQPGTETGFLHTHKTHEELYFFLKGKGEFQVDGKVFPISEGSVVRVAPAGKRSVRNNGTEPLIMLCVQYKVDTFTSEDAMDGNILNGAVKW
jgi:mannose-6-phosphate isomerase-like protein (cupin superfamily)